MIRRHKNNLGSIRNGDRETLEAFLAYLEESYNISSDGVVFPEDSNRSSPEVDAIVKNVAIEHTSIDSIKGQRSNNAIFQLVFVPVMQEFSPQAKEHYWIVVPFDEIKKIREPQKAREHVRIWFKDTILTLPPGVYSELNIPVLNLSASVQKCTDLWPTVIFLRSAQRDPNLSANLRDRVLQKTSKLEKYKQLGFRTCVLIESEDIAFMSQHIFTEIFSEAFDLSAPPHTDIVFFADSSDSGRNAKFHLIYGHP